MPWILLAILALFPQIGLVSSYFIYRGDISGDALGGEASYGISTTDAEGRTIEMEFTCAAFEDGGLPPSIAQDIEALPPEERAQAMAMLEDYRSGVCDDESGLLESESRKFFVMPASITNG